MSNYCELSNLTKTYASGLQALKRVDLAAVEHGGTVVRAPPASRADSGGEKIRDRELRRGAVREREEVQERAEQLKLENQLTLTGNGILVRANSRTRFISEAQSSRRARSSTKIRGPC